jgi:thioesterase domain-containing protein/aryl carrier-like protein
MRHDDLPRTPRMKIDRRALERAPLVRWRSIPIRPGRSDFEWWCVAAVRGIIGMDDFGPDDDLFEAGLDSLGALELGAAMAEAGYGDFDPPRLLEARTVAGIEPMLGAPDDPRRSSVVMLNNGGRQPPLFAFCGGAGNAVEWRFLAAELGPDQPIAVIEMRGMHSDEPPDRTIDARADHAVAEIEARLGSDDPCLIVAFSGGGPTGYETAQRMQAEGRRVHLVLLDSAPSTKDRVANPNRPAPKPPSELPTIRAASLRELPGAVARSARHRRKHRRFEALIRDPGPPSFARERYRAFRQIQLRANGDYDPAPAAFPATLVLVDGSDARRRCGELMPDFVVREIGGFHETMLAPPYVGEVATIVADILEPRVAADGECRSR